MHAPRRDALEMLRVGIARPPDDVRGLARKVDHVLAGAAAGLQDVAGFAGEELLQFSPDRLMVAVECRGIETAIRLDPLAIFSEFHDKLRHVALPVHGWLN